MPAHLVAEASSLPAVALRMGPPHWAAGAAARPGDHVVEVEGLVREHRLAAVRARRAVGAWERSSAATVLSAEATQRRRQPLRAHGREVNVHLALAATNSRCSTISTGSPRRTTPP